MDEQRPPHDNDSPSNQAQPDETKHHDTGGQDGDPLEGEVCCRDTVLTINGHTIDLAREPLKIEFCGFTLDVSYSAAKERTPGETHVEHFKDYEITITGPDKGDPLKGMPPGRLFINGKHIEYVYHTATGEIGHAAMFTLHRSLSDFARTYVVTNPTLADLPTHHH